MKNMEVKMKALITREYLGSSIEFKMVGNEVYANATGMCKHFGKDAYDWLKTKQTKEYIEKLAQTENNRFENLVETIQGGVSKGTWIHEKLILDLARWLDVSFRVWCDEQVASLLKSGRVETVKPSKKLEDKTPTEILADNGKALNDLFSTLELNIPKEIIISTAIHTTHRETGYDFAEVKLLLNKIDEESYHTKSEICKRVGIKANKVNMSLIELGLQIEGTTTMHPFILTELGKRFGVERSYTNGSHQGYEIKLKETAEDYIRENLDKLPATWIK